MPTPRILRSFIFVLFVSSILAACGSGPTNTAPPEQVGASAASSGEASAAAAAQEPVAASTEIAGAGSGETKLQVTVWVGSSELEALAKLAEKYTATHPDVQVEFVNIIDGGPYGRDKVQQMIAGGTPPDLLMLNTGQFEGFASRGALAPLDEQVKTDGFDMGVYFPAAVTGATYDGKLYGLPKDVSDVVVYLNVDMFEKAGIPLPEDDWTWDDYRNIAKQLTKDNNGDGNIDQWGTAIVNAVWAWAGFVWPNGGEILSQDRKSCELTRPETVEALKFYYGLLNDDKASVPPGALPQTPGQGDQFLAGVVGMSTFGPWFRPGLVESDNFKWTVRPYPRTNDGKRAISVLYTDHWAMSAATKHPKEAWELLKYLGGPEGQTAWSELYGSRSITPIQELATGEKWMSYGGPDHLSDNQAILDQLDSTLPPPVNFGNANAAETAWNEELDLVINGQQSVEDAVKNACDKITPILQQP